jgi:small subunit ribosomal protein S18
MAEKASSVSSGSASFPRLKRKTCKLCMEGVQTIDFRDVQRLSKYISERGKILPRRITGNCARHQRKLARAIKQARMVALMPYVAIQ